MALTLSIISVFIVVIGFSIILLNRLNHLKKKTGKELHISEEMFRLMVSCVRDYAIFMIDENGIIVSWNEGASRIKGYSSEEIMGKHISVFYTDEEIESGEPEHNLNTAERAGRFEREGWRKRKDGSLFWADVVFTAMYDEKKKLRGFAKITRDNTEKKKMEEQLLWFNQKLEELVRVKTTELTSVFERVSDGIVAFDNDDQITYANKKTGEINKRKPEELIGKNFWVEFPLASNPEFYKNYQKSIAEQQNVHFEMFAPALDIWVENFMYPSSDGLSLFFRDINEKKKSEASLRHSEEIRQLIMNSSLDAIICIDKRGLITGWNQQAERIFGWKEYEMKGKQLNETIIPDRYRKERAMEFRKFLQKQESPFINKIIEITVLHQSGKEFPVEFSIAPIKQHETEFFCAFIRDITERKSAEKQIIKEKELSDSVINSLPGIFYLFDSGGRFLRWNNNLETLSGYSADEILELSPFEFFDGIDKAYIIGRIGNTQSETSSSVEALFLTKAGERIPYYFTARTISYADKTCILGTGIDISQRKKAEQELRLSAEKYKLLFERNPMPMWMISSSDNRFIDVNDAALKHYGYGKEEFISLNTEKIRPEEDKNIFLMESKEDIPGISYRGILRHKRKDNSIINVEVYANDFIHEGKETKLILANDISEQTKAEESLKQSYEEIRQLAFNLQDIREEERATIAREIHDELGQQLTALKMDISWVSLRLNIQDDGQIKQKINGTLKLLDGTIKTVRRIATDLRPSILDNLGLIAAIEWQSEEFQKRTGIVTRFTTDVTELEFSPQMAIGLFRICQESLTNIARYAQAKNAFITLEQKDDELLLTIADNGKGFDIHKISHKKTLGLLGMRERTMMMGGNYEMVSGQGKGTKLLIRIPYPVLQVNK